MTRKKPASQAAAVEIETTQEPPTQPVTRDANGFELDGWGLPVCGPVRAARLAELGKPDPHDEPDAWADVEDEDAVVVNSDLSAVSGAVQSGDNDVSGAGSSMRNDIEGAAQ